MKLIAEIFNFKPNKMEVIKTLNMKNWLSFKTYHKHLSMCAHEQKKQWHEQNQVSLITYDFPLIIHASEIAELAENEMTFRDWCLSCNLSFSTL